MKKSNELRLSMGLKQWEMAMLLGISREQWAMYESGRRNLPAATSQKHADLVMMHLQSEAKLKKTLDHATDHSALLHKMLKENQYQQQLIERKLGELRQKIQPMVKRRELNEMLSVAMFNKDHKSPTKKILPQKSTDKYLEALVRFKIKLEVLQAEEKILGEKLIDS